MKHWLIYLLLAVTALAANAQSVAVELDTNAILIGDRFQLSLSPTAPASYNINLPLVPPEIELDSGIVMEKLEMAVKDTVRTEDSITHTAVYNMTVFDTGYFVIKPFKVAFTSPEGSTDTLETEAKLLAVKGISLGEKPELKDIKGPVDLPFQISEILSWLIIGGVAILLVLVISFVVIYFVNKEQYRSRYVAPPKPQIPAHEQAYQRLKQLEEERLWQNGRVKEYYIELSDIIREYLENRFEQPALEQTTDEIIHDFGGFPSIDESLLKGLKETLELADLVKFAKVSPMDTEHIGAMKFAYRLVSETKPTSVTEAENNNEEGESTTA